MGSSFDFLVLAAAFGAFAYGMAKKYRRIKIGGPEDRFDGIYGRIAEAKLSALGHKQILKDRPQGLYHYLLFLAFALPLAIVVAIQFGVRLPRLAALGVSLALDVLPLLGLFGTTMLLLRRYKEKPDRLDNKPEDAWIYVILYAIFVTGFLTEGFRMATVSQSSDIFAPVGFALGKILKGMFGEGSLGMLKLMWRTHIYLVLLTFALIPYTKFSHVVTGPINWAFRNRGPKGAFKKLDLENSEEFGAGKIENLTWKDMLDLEACVRCGRCQARCPAYNTGKSLSPKKVIQDLKAHLIEKEPFIHAGNADGYTEPLINGKGVNESDLWACTTCRHCMEVCPVKIEHVDKIVEMRRHMVLMEGEMPQELVGVNKNLENNFNPWGVGWSARNDWTRRRGVNPPILKEGEDQWFDVLLWVGCAGSFDDRYQRVIASLVRLMDKAGVRYAILGTGEKCCGDPARATGNEYLYQSLVTENVELMNGLGVKKIIAPCPHCLKSLAREYPQFGGNYEVVHHGSFLLNLVKEGKLAVREADIGTVTFHDSCYLSRYNAITEEPRQIIRTAGGKLVEMERNREDNFCCGAGGGRMFMEEEGERINNARTEEALKTGASTIASACPFCLTMLTDGLKAKGKEEDIKALDIAEIIERACL